MMGKIELRLLSVLDAPKYEQELADELEYRTDTISESLTKLEELDLIHKEKRGIRTLAVPGEAHCIEVFQSLTKTHAHVDFPDLLTTSMLDVLYYLHSDETMSAKELADRTGYSSATIYRNLKTLTNRAMAKTDHSHYALTNEFQQLHDFADGLKHHLHRATIKNTVGTGTIVWESQDEFLLRTESRPQDPEFLHTGLDAFSEYGLAFFTTSERYYLHSETRDSLSPADLVCHLLLIENDSRHRKYALLLMAHTNIDYKQLEQSARYYGLDDTVLQLFEFLDSRGISSGEQTPNWEEFESLANEYEVAL